MAKVRLPFGIDFERLSGAAIDDVRSRGPCVLPRRVLPCFGGSFMSCFHSVLGWINCGQAANGERTPMVNIRGRTGLSNRSAASSALPGQLKAGLAGWVNSAEWPARAGSFPELFPAAVWKVAGCSETSELLRTEAMSAARPARGRVKRVCRRESPACRPGLRVNCPARQAFLREIRGCLRGWSVFRQAQPACRLWPTLCCRPKRMRPNLPARQGRRPWKGRKAPRQELLL